MLKDFRESFASDLRDPEFQREQVAVAYEEEGPEGVLRALRDIADAEHNSPAAPSLALLPAQDGLRYFRAVRDALSALDLDLAIVRKSASPR